MESVSFTMQDLDRLIPHRRAESHKDHYGRVLALCGSVGYTGAAYFAAQAAVRTGSGVVTLCTPRTAWPVLAGKLQEPVVYPVEEDKEGRMTEKGAAQALELAPRASAILIGPGLGRSDGTLGAVRYVLSKADCPVIVDADGINVLAGHIDILRSARSPVILTPHQGELRRLTGLDAPEDKDARALSWEVGAVILYKGHRSRIFSPDGLVCRNTTGNPGMAKGGSGDVLSGVILSLLGQGLSPFSATCAGAFIHGAAGDRCADALGEYGMTPSDLLMEIPAVLRRYNTKEWSS